MPSREKMNLQKASVPSVKKSRRRNRSSAKYMAEERAWLKLEAEKVVEYCLEFGCRRFPIGHCQLKEHVDAILRVQLKKKFPA
ncbi:hypothetical protein BDR06DRAFT_1003477 [Suillus hirtellus]|nr:hypothetical protein BDR06DRAFT_1003477 [Suillus hirtellus]